MRRTAIALILLILMSVALVSACQKKNEPAAPSAPAATATSTNVNSPTLTMTCTQTATATITPTFTSTPPDIMIDNVEDGNSSSLFNTWMGYATGGSTVHSWGPASTSPKNGSYAMELTATVNVTGSYAFTALNTGATAGVTPIDVRAYNKLRFYRKLDGTLISGTKSFVVTMTDDINSVSYTIGAVFSPNFEEWDLNLRTSYSLSGGTIEDLLSGVKQITFEFFLNGAVGSTAEVEIVLDDIRFTHN
jgi:hypothetical protein